MFATDKKAQSSLSGYSADGRHFVASYKGCDQARLLDVDSLVSAVRRAINASGATILQQNVQPFAGGGMTAVFLLSESHASIHTYPEYNGCFVDLFTCGVSCDGTAFDAVLRDYLMPAAVDCESLSRKLD